MTNPATGVVRTATSNENGIYIVPQLAPGNYNISVEKQGFGAEKREMCSLKSIRASRSTSSLGSLPPPKPSKSPGPRLALNTTSSTLTDVVGHDETVDLPLNGREFTQLTLLTPGAAPITTGQQSAFTVALGKGGISPSVNGQRGQQNNFTMDGR